MTIAKYKLYTNNIGIVGRGIGMRENMRNDIEKYTEIIKSAFQIPTPISDIDAIVDRLGGRVEETAIDRWADGKLEASQQVPTGFIIKVSPFQSFERRNFTIAHELGHLFLHTNYLEVSSQRSNELVFEAYYRDGESEEEYQANEFAANLLMPKEDFCKSIKNNLKNGIVEMDKVAAEFYVSLDAAITRGKWLGILSW